MPTLPLSLDQDLLIQRILARERELRTHLTQLEQSLQNFEEVERRTYESWLRLEFGPKYADLESIYEEIRVRKILAQRVQELVESRGFHPREALYVATSATDPAEVADEEFTSRRRAKQEAKRASRREARRERINEKATPSPFVAKTREHLVSIYRRVARKLHPDSPLASKEISPQKALGLWHDVQFAYQAGNYERLLAIAVWLESQGGPRLEPQAGPGTQSFSERLSRIRSLEKSCLKPERRMEELRSHPAWEFSSLGGALRKKLRKKIARDVEEEFSHANDVLTALEDLIASIGPPRQPKIRR